MQQMDWSIEENTLKVKRTEKLMHIDIKCSVRGAKTDSFHIIYIVQNCGLYNWRNKCCETIYLEVNLFLNAENGAAILTDGLTLSWRSLVSSGLSSLLRCFVRGLELLFIQTWNELGWFIQKSWSLCKTDPAGMMERRTRRKNSCTLESLLAFELMNNGWVDIYSLKLEEKFHSVSWMFFYSLVMSG